MVFAFPGAGALDYFPCQYGTSRLLFRGPRRNIDRPYLACLGGTETYGKYVQAPFPVLLEEAVDMPVVNLGCVNAGADVYLNETPVADLASRAQAIVLQITGAQNLSNRYYSVHPRRNDRVLGATPLLRALFREVDFTEFHFTNHLLTSLASRSPDRFEVLAEELRAAWVTRMKLLLSRLQCPVVLLWLGEGAPPAPGGQLRPGHDPTLVDAEMLATIRPETAALVEVRVPMQSRNAEGMIFGPMEAPAAAALPGPAAHVRIAEALATALQPYL
jgi:hypothetical protein